MTKGVLYVRVSSKEQQEEGYSVDAQVEHGLEYARRQKIEIVRTWTIAESAKAADREGFAELVAFVKSHSDVQAMIFEKADRMTRNYNDLVRIYDLVEKHGKQAHFFKENFYIDKDSKSSEKLRLDIQVVLARNYINNLSEEVIKGMNQKVKKGGFPAIAPTGYLNDIPTREIVVDPHASGLIKRIYQMFATGRYTLEDMVDFGRKEGLQHPIHKKPMEVSSLYHILTNPFYYGLVRWRDQVVMGKHEPLISKALFDRVQSVFTGLKRSRKKRVAFLGFAECGHCGSQITSEWHNKKQKNGTSRVYVYYRCTGWNNGRKPCPGSHISEKDLVIQLGAPLKNLRIDLQTVQKIKQALSESFEGEKEFHGKRVTALRAEASKLKSWIDRAYTDRLEGLLTTEEYRDKVETWRNRLFDVQNEIRAHETADASYIDQGSRILDLAQRAHALWEQQSDNHERRKLIDAVVSKVVIKDRKAVLNLREPFSTVCKLAVAAKSGDGTSGWYAREELNL